MKTVVLLSGGVDSTVALARALADGDDAMALSFNYGQIHKRELAAAEAVAAHYGVHHRVIDLSAALPHGSALTGLGLIPETHATAPDATLVPGRNIVMLAVGIGIAEGSGGGAVVIGANADDRAGYPDCRSEFFTAIDHATRRSTDGRVCVWAPLIRMSKADIFALGHQLGAPLDLTWSCYRGGDAPCGRCGACESNGVTA